MISNKWYHLADGRTSSKSLVVDVYNTSKYIPGTSKYIFRSDAITDDMIYLYTYVNGPG